MSRVRGGVFRLGPVMLLALIAVLGAWLREVRADGGCKADGARCANNMSCCGHNCMKPAPPPGKAKPVFGTCCTLRACGAQDCGMVSDGCGGMLDCGPCPTTTTTATSTSTTTTTIAATCSFACSDVGQSGLACTTYVDDADCASACQTACENYCNAPCLGCM